MGDSSNATADSISSFTSNSAVWNGCLAVEVPVVGEYDQNECAASWTHALCGFEQRWEENGKSCTGLFSDKAEGKRGFCQALANCLSRNRLDDLKVAESEVILATLRVVTAILCERDIDAEPLFSESAFASYCVCLVTCTGNSAVGEQALKVLNNALYDHPVNQRTFCALPREYGFGALSVCLAEGCHSQGFYRTSIVAMYLVAEGAASSEICHAFATPCVKSLTSLAAELQSEQGRRLELSGSAPGIGKVACLPLQGGLQLLYASCVAYPTVLGEMFAASRAFAVEKSQGSPAKLVAMFEALDLDNTKAPELDRLGLLVIRIIQACSTSDESKENVGDSRALRAQAVNVLMVASGHDSNIAEFFVALGAAKILIGLLDTQLADLMRAINTQESGQEKKAGDRTLQLSGSAITFLMQSFKKLLPIVIACNNLAKTSAVARAQMVPVVFPYVIPLPNLDALESDEEQQRALNNTQMKGITPHDVLGGRLITLMMSLDSNIKRFAGELLYTLCDNDANTMTYRCGYGASAHILAIKGGTIGGIIAQQEERQRQKLEQQRGSKQ